jgi:hypothetical protein
MKSNLSLLSPLFQWSSHKPLERNKWKETQPIACKHLQAKAISLLGKWSLRGASDCPHFPAALLHSTRKMQIIYPTSLGLFAHNVLRYAY